MRLKTFSVRERHGEFPEFLGAFARDRDDARALLKVVYAERRGKPRRARSRQHVIRAGAVVAERLGGITPEENRAGVADPLQPLLRFGDRELQMFRSDAVGDVPGPFVAFHLDPRAAP